MSAIFRQVCCKMALYKAKLMTSAASLWGSFSFMWNIFAGTKIQEDPQGRMTSLCLFTVYLNTRCVCSPAFSNPLVFVERKISKELLPTLWEKFTGRRLVRTSTTSRQRHYRGGGWLLTKTFPSWCYIDWVLDGMYRYVYLYIQVHTCMYKDIYIYTQYTCKLLPIYTSQTALMPLLLFQEKDMKCFGSPCNILSASEVLAWHQ